ncbi:MAG TPA: DUF5602 domain-containing protein [Aldersonia sp.]
MVRSRPWAVRRHCSSVAAATTPEATDATSYGPSEELGDGTVKAFTVTDADGNPTAVGIRMTASALDGLPTATAPPPAPPPPGAMVMVDFPDEASSTVFDHVMVDWNSLGHEPTGVFDEPHFDVHFYMTDMASVTAIDPASPDFAAKSANLPAPQYIPQGYVPIPDSVVPAMGVHMADGSTPIVPGSYDFTEVLLTGAWDGDYTFIEPMITRDFLLTKPTVHEQIPQPAAYQQSGYYPTTYDISFDEGTQEYVITLGGLAQQTQS